MDAFVVKVHDAQSAIKLQAELVLKKHEETGPPVKKVKHDDDDDVEIINEIKPPAAADVKALNTSLNSSNPENCPCSDTQSDASPQEEASANGEHCKTNDDDNDKISPPKQKRRKLSDDEKAAKSKQKEEARLLKEKRQDEKEKKEREKEEVRLKREQERIAKEKEKQAKKEQLEKERLEREKEKQLKKEKLEQERLEKLKKKEELNLAKEEERKKREEDRKQKEEERKQKEEERRKKDEDKKLKDEEEQRKKEKAKESFKSFFIKKSPPKKVVLTDEKYQMFKPFEVKPNVTMAPIVRRKPIENNEQFTEALLQQESTTSYLKELTARKCGTGIKYKIARHSRCERKRPESKESQEDMDVIVLENESSPARKTDSKNWMHVKLLQFCENYRPPYYGTWRKRSKVISARNPVNKDEDLLNYEIDSDEEWEEEEPGESLSGPENDDEDDEEDNENDEENDGFFVPHGYLSDDEGVNASDGEREEEQVDIRDKKLDKTEGFPFEKKSKMKNLRATCFGSVWLNSSDDVPEFLAGFKVNPMIKIPFDIFSVKEDIEPKEKSTVGERTPSNTPRVNNNIPLRVPEEAMPLLINHVHKSSSGLNKLISTFLEFWDKRRNTGCTEVSPTQTQPRISKRQLERKILEIAKREALTDSAKTCYVVQSHIMERYKTELDTLKSVQQSPSNSLPGVAKLLVSEKHGQETNNHSLSQPGCSQQMHLSETVRTQSPDSEPLPMQVDSSPEHTDKCTVTPNGQPGAHTTSSKLDKVQMQREIIIL